MCNFFMYDVLMFNWLQFSRILFTAGSVLPVKLLSRFRTTQWCSLTEELVYRISTVLDMDRTPPWWPFSLSTLLYFHHAQISFHEME